MLRAVAVSAGDAGKETTPASGTASAADWMTYQSAATGLSFRYPPALRIRERDPESFGLPDVEEITELRGDTKLNPDTVVLRFFVKRGTTTPEAAAAQARAERERHARPDADSRESVTTMELDGHDALVSVGCGRAACHWGVSILQPRVCMILTLIPEPIEDSLSPPHDGTFPLLSIIKTVHVERRPKRRARP
jgi:hypothetical protein